MDEHDWLVSESKGKLEDKQEYHVRLCYVVEPMEENCTAYRTPLFLTSSSLHAKLYSSFISRFEAKHARDVHSHCFFSLY